jgi:membrane protease YdiL (CAAX protease family)
MPTVTLLSFIFIGLSYLSLWVRKDFRLWGSLVVLSLIFGFISGNVQWLGFVFVAIAAALWIWFYQQKARLLRTILFLVLITASIAFTFRLFSGFTPIALTDKLKIGLAKPLFCLFPLALFVPLARNFNDWKKVAAGLLIGCLGIAILAIIAIASGAVHWHYKIPSHPEARYLSNFFLVSMPEEAFYRGFMQNEFCRYFQGRKGGKILALFLTSILFTLVHLYWSPNFSILAFVFVASLLYGGIYLISGKIESAILTHFLLNATHMTFFSYHAM